MTIYEQRKAIKARCMEACWYADDPYGQKLYYQGYDYMMDREHPQAIYFQELIETLPGVWEPNGKWLREPPPKPVLKKAPVGEDQNVTVSDLLGIIKQLTESSDKRIALLEEALAKKDAGDDALEKILKGDKKK